jgi:hypothetical protein
MRHDLNTVAAGGIPELKLLVATRYRRTISGTSRRSLQNFVFIRVEEEETSTLLSQDRYGPGIVLTGLTIC